MNGALVKEGVVEQRNSGAMPPGDFIFGVSKVDHLLNAIPTEQFCIDDFYFFESQLSQDCINSLARNDGTGTGGKCTEPCNSMRERCFFKILFALCQESTQKYNFTAGPQLGLQFC